MWRAPFRPLLARGMLCLPRPSTPRVNHRWATGSPPPLVAQVKILNPQFYTQTMKEYMEAVSTPDSPAPIGPYSQAIKANGLVFLSGMMPATPDGKQVTGSVAEMTHQMCRNTAAVLQSAGSNLEKTVKVTVYFANLDDFTEMNEVYATYFPHKPARSAIEAKRLPAGTSMEMDVIAVQ